MSGALTWAALATPVPLHGGGSGLVPRGTREEVFSSIFDVFLVLGTAVGVVVIGYMLVKAYANRHGAGHSEDTKVARPELGELPSGSGGGRKLFVSFGMSAVIVVSLITWTYGTLLFVEEKPAAAESAEAEPTELLEIKVIGQQFSWTFVYPNGHSTNTLRVPRGADIHLVVTSRDVFHNFGIPETRVKADAIPGQTTDTWFVADEVGTYTARCYELCGAGHSYMTADVVVMPPAEFESWYENTSDDGGVNATVSTDEPTGALAGGPAATGVGA